MKEITAIVKELTIEQMAKQALVGNLKHPDTVVVAELENCSHALPEFGSFLVLIRNETLAYGRIIEDH